MKKPRIFLISDGSVAEDKFEEAASIVRAGILKRVCKTKKKNQIYC